jgi:hypothetical protein
MVEEGKVEEKVKVSESLTLFNIGDRVLELREMKTRRSREMFELIHIIRNEIQRRTAGSTVNDPMTVEMIDYLDKAVADILNFLFRLPAGEALTVDWVTDNFSPRLFENVVNEAAGQSRVDWLPPFLRPFSSTWGPNLIVLKKEAEKNEPEKISPSTGSITP